MNRASIESQLNNIPCDVEDTEEMFWLRESDDYQSKVKLGNLLAAQYRFKEAAQAYENAASIKSTEPTLFLSLGGSYLTLFKYDEALLAYEKAMSLGASAKALAYPLGILHYLKQDYHKACEYFLQCLPCGGEMKIAIIYWHTLASYLAGTTPTLLDEFTEDMDVGHHTAYKKAVSVFKANAGPVNNALNNKNAYSANDEPDCSSDNDLDRAIILYGLSVYYNHIGNNEKSSAALDEALKCDSVWPCVSYLAAYRLKARH